MIRLLRTDLALPAVVAVAGALSGCAEEEPRAALLAPDDVELHWNEAFNAVDDRLAAFVPVDVMVYEAATGAPLPSARLLIGSDDPNVAVLLPDAVAPVDPDLCASWLPQVNADLEGEAPDPCADLTWDAWRDLYVSVEPSFPASTSDVATGELELWTDEDGVARAYVWVDAFPTEDGAFEPTLVEIDLPGQPDSGASFSLRPR